MAPATIAARYDVDGNDDDAIEFDGRSSITCGGTTRSSHPVNAHITSAAAIPAPTTLPISASCRRAANQPITIAGTTTMAICATPTSAYRAGCGSEVKNCTRSADALRSAAGITALSTSANVRSAPHPASRAMSPGCRRHSRRSPSRSSVTTNSMTDRAAAPAKRAVHA